MGSQKAQFIERRKLSCRAFFDRPRSGIYSSLLKILFLRRSNSNPKWALRSVTTTTIEPRKRWGVPRTFGQLIVRGLSRNPGVPGLAILCFLKKPRSRHLRSRFESLIFRFLRNFRERRMPNGMNCFVKNCSVSASTMGPAFCYRAGWTAQMEDTGNLRLS